LGRFFTPSHSLVCSRLSTTYPPIGITRPAGNRGQQEKVKQTWLVHDGMGLPDTLPYRFTRGGPRRPDSAAPGGPVIPIGKALPCASDLNLLDNILFDGRTLVGRMELGECLVKLLQHRYSEIITLSAPI
jgi:hypothetical protein